MNPNHLGEIIGKGQHQTVYVHGEDEQKVVKTTNELYPSIESPTYVKARYYLTKILHRLFPNNIPDVHLEASSENRSTIVSERVFPIQEYEDLMQQHMSSNRTDEEYLQFKRRVHAHNQRIASHPQYLGIRSQLIDLDVGFDTTKINFSEDINGNVVYLDKLDPVLLNGQESIQKLRKFILEYGQDCDKASLLSSLDRYEAIVNSDAELVKPTVRRD